MLLIYPDGFKQQMHFHNSKSILCKVKAIQTRIAAKFPSKTFFAARLLFLSEQMPSLHCLYLCPSSFHVPDLASYSFTFFIFIVKNIHWNSRVDRKASYYLKNGFRDATIDNTWLIIRIGSQITIWVYIWPLGDEWHVRCQARTVNVDKDKSC